MRPRGDGLMISTFCAGVRWRRSGKLQGERAKEVRQLIG
jgi:hypothetical protein